MKRRRLIWQLYPSYLLITLLSLLAVTIYTASTLQSFFVHETAENLKARARLIEPEMINLLVLADYDSLQTNARQHGQRSETRITVILPDGIVIADSDQNPERMDPHDDRPEVVAALDGTTGSSTRFSSTLKEEMMYVALPVYHDGKLLAILRTSKSLKSVNQTINMLLVNIGIGSLIVAIAATIISWVNARWISKPLERMRLRALRIAAGDRSGRLAEEGSEEISTLANAINLMLIQLDDRIRFIEQQRSEQDAVFSSISDGVLAIDANGLLLTMNTTAASMLELKHSNVRGRPVRDAIQNKGLRQFIMRTLKTNDEVEDEILLGELDPRYIQTHGCPLRETDGRTMGAVVVLNDVTRLRHLEKARRDFVANVSHELRTPVTSIIGYVETLQDTPVEDTEATERFIEIIRRQSDRLEKIIEDLLSLARIERDAEGSEIELYEVSIDDVIANSLGFVKQLATARNVDIQVNIESAVDATLNQALIEQAVVNLLTNAIKYSDVGTSVQVHVLEMKKRVMIQVKDHGVGIASEHLPRIFERFYRVDKGRSRAEGGTGLGLAIVKHIALAHGGTVHVESELGVGSEFTISIPTVTR